MNRLLIIILFALIQLPFSLKAEERVIVERLELQDGTVLEGYSSAQSSTLKFKAFVSTITLPSKAVVASSIRCTDVSISSLDKDWRDWLKKQPELRKQTSLPIASFRINHNSGLASVLETINFDQTATLSEDAFQLVSDQVGLKKFPQKNQKQESVDSKSEKTTSVVKVDTIRKVVEKIEYQTFSIVDKLEDPSNVYLFKQGAYYSFVDVAMHEYTFDWSNVKRISRIARDPRLVSGLIDVIETKGGNVYRGIISEQVPGKMITINLLDGHKEIVIKSSEIKKLAKEGMNPEQSIIEQSPLIEKIVLATGGSETGIVTEQVYVTANNKDRTNLTILKEDGTSRLLTHANVIETRRFPNLHYKPVFDTNESKEAYQINSNWTFSFEETRLDDGIVYVSDRAKVTEINLDELSPRGTLCMSFNIDDDTEDIRIISSSYFKKLEQKTTSEKVQEYMASVMGLTSVNSTNFKTKGFSLESFLQNGVEPIKIKKKVYLKYITFKVDEIGEFIVYLPQTKQCVILKITM